MLACSSSGIPLRHIILSVSALLPPRPASRLPPLACLRLPRADLCMFYACCATTSAPFQAAGLQAKPGMPPQVLQHAGKASEYKKDSLNLFLPPAYDVPCGEHI